MTWKTGSKKHNDLLRSLQKFIPRRCFVSFSLTELAQDFTQTSSKKPDNINMKSELWKQKWRELNTDSRSNTAIEALKTCNLILYPNIWKLLQILATLPVSTTPSERTFSTLIKASKKLPQKFNGARSYKRSVFI